MTTQARNFLCGCCGQGSAAISNDQFPLGKNQTCASMGVQTDSFKCRSYCQQDNQAENHQYYPQDYPQDYQDYSQDDSQEYVDPCAEYYSNQNGSEPEYRPYDIPTGSRNKYYDDSSKYQNDSRMTRHNNYGERGYQKRDEMRCRYDPLSSRFINYGAVDGYQNEVTRDGHDNLTGKASRNGKAAKGRLGDDADGHGGSQTGNGKNGKKGRGGHPDGHGTQMGSGKDGKNGNSGNTYGNGTQMGSGKDGKNGNGGNTYRNGTQMGSGKDGKNGNGSNTNGNGTQMESDKDEKNGNGHSVDKDGKHAKVRPGGSSEGHIGTHVGSGKGGKQRKGLFGGKPVGQSGSHTGSADSANSALSDGSETNDGHGTAEGQHHLRHKQGGGSGLPSTATIMQYNQPPWFPNHGRFSSNLRAFSALPHFRSRSGSDPAGNGLEWGQGSPGNILQGVDPAGDGHELDQGNPYRGFHRRAPDPGNLHSRSIMETRDMRRRNLSSPFPRPPVTTYSIPQASCSENPFDPFPRDSPGDIWHNNNNPQAYLFGWGKKKATKNTGDGTNKLKKLYQINNAGVTCNCGQRLQFNLSVEENEGRCVACFEELRQDFADLLDLYKEMGYAPCECKGRISVSDLANEYLMDQANNASGRGWYENLGAPRKKGHVKTIELTPTDGFTGCMCREIKMELFRKPSDLLSCQCDTDRPNIVLRPPSDYNDDFDDGEDEEESLPEDEPEPEEELDVTEMMSEPESEIYYASEPASRSNSSLKTPTISSAETVYSVDTRGSTSSAFIERTGRKSVATTSGSKQSNSSNTASYETAPSDSSIQSNKTFIISSPK